MQRRELLRGLAALAASSPFAASLAAPPRSRVIVIGGGMAGTTVAKYLRMWGDRIQVVLIERSPRYTSNIFSSLVLTGQRSLSSLSYRYDALRTRYGVQVVQGEVSEVDPVARRVSLADGRSLTADRIVMAPGIDFDTVPGLADPSRMPHAWQAGPQTTLLRRQLVAMPDGGTVVLTIPKTPYRCPPGPYERSCLLADWLKQFKPRSKLLVLDANLDFVAEKGNFSEAFYGLHADVIEYRTQTEVLSADSGSMTLQTTTGPVHGDVINLIPRQRCGPIVAQAGLATATEGRFAPVDVLGYESSVAPGVHVIGDSSATTQPKAGHIANQEAKVCADAIQRLLRGVAPDPAPVTNSSCYSTITMREASWLHSVFQYDPLQKLMVAQAAATGESDGWSGDDFEQMETWFNALMADSFA